MNEFEMTNSHLLILCLIRSGRTNLSQLMPFCNLKFGILQKFFEQLTYMKYVVVEENGIKITESGGKKVHFLALQWQGEYCELWQVRSIYL